MTYSTKNYTEQGGDRTVIGGELATMGDGRITLLGTQMKPAAGQVDTTDTPSALRDAFNTLLANLQAAGLMQRAILSLTDAGGNVVETVTTYLNVDSFENSWVVDAIIKSSQPIPAGTTIDIAGLGGDPYEVPVETDTLWLSDVINGQNADAPTRTKLNTLATQAFNFTVAGLAEALTTDLTYTVVAANNAALEGTHQGSQDFGEPAVLTAGTLAEVTFSADE